MGVRKELGTELDLGPLLGLGRGASRFCTLRFSGLCFAGGLPGPVVFVACCRFKWPTNFTVSLSFQYLDKYQRRRWVICTGLAPDVPEIHELQRMWPERIGREACGASPIAKGTPVVSKTRAVSIELPGAVLRSHMVRPPNPPVGKGRPLRRAAD